MLLRQLEYFSAVVESGSFTEAAKHCFVSQSAISQQVKALEKELGTTLLERKGKSFTLTPAGEQVLSAAHDVRTRIDQMKLALTHRSREEQRKLRIGYLSRYDGWEIQGALAAFTLKYPFIETTAVAGSHDDLYEMLLSGAVDIAFNDRRRELSDEFVNEYLMTRYTYIEVSGANELSYRDSLAVSQLGDTPCILIAKSQQRAIERDYYKNVLNFPSPFIFAENLEEARMMVAGNRGFLPLEIGEEIREQTQYGGVIKRIPLTNAEGKLSRTYYAFWLKSKTNWLVKEFATILKELLS